MASEDKKTRDERAALERFLDATNSPIVRSTIRKLKGDSQPDFACCDTGGQEQAFEMTAICAEEVAELVARPEVGSVWTADPTERIVRDKMHKKYQTHLPIDLVCYWDGRTVSTDDMIRPRSKRWLTPSPRILSVVSGTTVKEACTLSQVSLRRTGDRAAAELRRSAA